MEQIVRFPGEGLQDFRPGQSSPASSSFHSPAGSDDDANEPGDGFFRTFPHGKKCGVPGRSVRTCPGTSAHGPRRLMSSPGGSMSRRRRRSRSMRRTGGACSSSTSVSARRNTRLGVVFLVVLFWEEEEEEEEEQEEALQVLFWCADTALCAQVPLSLFFLALCSLSTAPCFWQSLVCCSPWFDSGYILCQFTAAFVAQLYYVAIITPVIHFCMGSLACGELCSFRP